MSFGSDFWDARYRADGAAYGDHPSRFLLAMESRLPPAPAKAFVPGDGQGRNGLWLARKGYQTLAVDLSGEAMGQLAAKAAEQGQSLEARQADLADYEPPAREFQVIAAIWLHLPADLRPRVHAKLAAALAPGGMLLLEAFHPRQLDYREAHGSGGPGDPAMLYDLALLDRDFPTLTREWGEEVEERLDEGAFHQGLGYVTRAVFRG